MAGTVLDDRRFFEGFSCDHRYMETHPIQRTQHNTTVTLSTPVVYKAATLLPQCRRYIIINCGSQ